MLLDIFGTFDGYTARAYKRAILLLRLSAFVRPQGRFLFVKTNRRLPQSIFAFLLTSARVSAKKKGITRGSFSSPIRRLCVPKMTLNLFELPSKTAQSLEARAAFAAFTAFLFS